MKINNINCNKPLRPVSFSGDTEQKNKRILYKHFHQMDDYTLGAVSINKAYQEVNKSKKMHLLKALPSLEKATIAAELIMTQPGNLTNKLVTGVGFLVFDDVFTSVADKTSKSVDKKFKNESEETKQTIKNASYLASAGAIMIGSILGIKGGKKLVSNHMPNVAKFISKEAVKIGSEIETSKLANVFNKHINPITNKHPEISKAVGFVSAVGTIFASNVAKIKLSNGISEDIKQKSQDNYSKAKRIQKMARDEFDRVDAIEV